jgi:hypothetical protein
LVNYIPQTTSCSMSNKRAKRKIEYASSEDEAIDLNLEEDSLDDEKNSSFEQYTGIPATPSKNNKFTKIFSKDLGHLVEESKQMKKIIKEGKEKLQPEKKKLRRTINEAQDTLSNSESDDKKEPKKSFIETARAQESKRLNKEAILQSVKKDGFKVEHITSYLPEMFEISGWTKFVDCLCDKYSTKSLISQADLKHIETYWLDALKNAKNKILARVCTNLQTNKWSDNSFDIRKEDDDWHTITVLQTKLNNLLANHDRTPTTELRILRDLRQRSEKRKEEEKKMQEREEREWNNLDQQSDIVQLKYFLNRFGPVKGKKKFSDWRGAHNLAQGTGFVADHVKQIGEKMDRMEQHLTDLKETNTEESLSNPKQNMIKVSDKQKPIIEKEKEKLKENEKETDSKLLIDSLTKPVVKNETKRAEVTKIYDDNDDDDLFDKPLL